MTENGESPQFEFIDEKGLPVKDQNPHDQI